MPSTPYDAKGLMVAAVKDNNPVMFIDDRWLYGEKADVPEEMYSVPLGKGIIRKRGKDVTVVAVSYMAHLAHQAANSLSESGIDVEMIDLRTVKPLDTELIFNSVRKTGRLVVADGGWKTGGFAGDIISLITENCFESLKQAPVRITLPDIPAPASSDMEKAYYPDVNSIISTIKKVIQK
jgi:pyruvate dehydrogenase E1 component beta subunit